MLRRKKLKGFSLYDFVICLFVLAFAVLCILPFWYTFTYSITPYADYLKNPVSLIPRNVTLEAYAEALRFPLLTTGFINSIFIVVAGSVLQVLVLVMTAYPLTKKNLKGTKAVMLLYIFTMFFSGGIIPEYFVMQKLHLINSLWALILSSVNGAYSIILMKNFLSSISESLTEAATIDGANDFQTLFHIVLPLSKPAVATMFLMYAVVNCNEFFKAIIYTTKRSVWPLQLVLREMILEGNMSEMMAANERTVFPFSLQMATVMLSIVPIICMYPFLQRYFVSGLTMGAVKE